MTCEVLKPGALTTVQAQPRRGTRHLGVPSAGPADPLSMALANRLVGNASWEAALEATLTGPVLRFWQPARVAVTGGDVPVSINDSAADCHTAHVLAPGDTLSLGAITSGIRAYIGIAGGIDVPPVLGSASTYLPAALGGVSGRALATGDRLPIGPLPPAWNVVDTPERFRPAFTAHIAVRAGAASETGLLNEESLSTLLATNWRISERNDRMGMALVGPRLRAGEDGRMPSRPVFPGTVQCPPAGVPFLLSVDAQTTGGYPRVLQVVRADRHLLGQLRPGDHLRFLYRSAEEAAADLAAKHRYWREWLPDVAELI